MSAVPQPPAAAASDSTSDPTSGPTCDPTQQPPTPPQAAGQPSARRAGCRSLAAASALGVLGAAIVLVAAGKTWHRGTAAFAQGSLPVHVPGREVTELPSALALVALAALVAVFAVRRAGRVVVAGLLTLSGAGAMATALIGAGDTSALDTAAATATGLARTSVHDSTTTAWPLICAAGGALLLAAGVLALLRGQAWPGMSSRYDRDGAPRTARPTAPRKATVDPDRPEDLWKALDRGEDPTA